MNEKLIVALEIGSSKVRAAAGSVDAAGILTVNDVEEVKLIDSVRYGVIRNVAEVADAITTVIRRLESRNPDYKITGVYLGVGARSLRSDTIEIERQLPSEMEITAAMVEDTYRQAHERLLEDRKVVDVTPREFRVDGAPIARPVGAYGHHLNATLNIISLRTQIWDKLSRVVIERLNLKIFDFFVRQLAEANTVMTSEEKRLGCVLVDFGAETTTVSIYKHGVLQSLSTIPLGSRNITRDICSLNHLEEQAEDLKIRGGNAMPGAESNPGAAEYAEINNYVSARAGEIIANISERIRSAGFTPEQLPAGIIIVGRGALLRNFSSRLASDSGIKKIRTGQPSSKIRVADSHIIASDAVDVISILAAAAAYDPQPCMISVKPEPVFIPETTPQPMAEPQPAAEVVTDTTPVPAPEPAKPAEPEPARPKKPSAASRFLQSIKNRVAELMGDEEEEEDE